jgi:hypothetical protein
MVSRLEIAIIAAAIGAVLGSVFSAVFQGLIQPPLEEISLNAYNWVRMKITGKQIPTKVLYTKSKELSGDIHDFVDDWESDAPRGPVWKQWDESWDGAGEEKKTQLRHQYSNMRSSINQTWKRRYREEFQSDVEIVLEEFRRRDFNVEALEIYNEEPTNTTSIRKLANELSNMADHLESDL